MAKHKVFKIDEVPSEKIGQLRKLARQGGTPAEAAALVAYPGSVDQFIRLARTQWRIEFKKAWKNGRAHEGYVAGEAIA